MGEETAKVNVIVEPVVLEIAADPRQVRLARLVAGGYGSLIGMDVDALDDLRIAIDELCVWLIEHGDGSRLSVRLTAVGDAIEVDGVCGLSGDDVADHDRHALARQILAVATEEHTVEAAEGRLRFWFRTHPVSP